MWLCEEILPRLRERHPGMTVTLAGTDPPRSIRRLASATVDVPGYVEDLDALMASRRVFVAPLRYGAGVKGKIVHALAAGIPVVTTPIGAEGIFEEGDARAGRTADEIVERVIEVYDDAARWQESAASGRAIAARFSPAAVDAQLADALDAAFGRLGPPAQACPIQENQGKAFAESDDNLRR